MRPATPPMTTARRFKDATYGQFARIAKALASPRRLELLDLLAQGPRTVEELAREAGLTLANTSQHLQVLRGAKLVEADKKGLFVTCRLADEGVARFFGALREVAESRLAEIDRVKRAFLADHGEMEAVDRKGLLKRVRAGRVTLLDVRPAQEYRAGHIPGAVSIPLPQLKRRLAELPRNVDVVAYCRGPYCVMALEAVKLLRARGFKALRLADGIPDWRARGLDVAVGDEARRGFERPTVR